MKTKATLAARFGLGLIFVIFGLNGFLQFLPQPPMPDQAMKFVGGLASSGYFFPFLKGTEVLMGVALLTGFLAPLALIILAPITLNIFLFHAFLTPGQVGLSVLMIALHVVAALGYAKAYRALFGTASSRAADLDREEALQPLGAKLG